MKTILLLEDNQARAREFETAVVGLGPDYAARVWSDARTMIEEIEDFLADAVLISLDHDLQKRRANRPEPGNGLEVAKHLTGYVPVCPVIVHAAHEERSWSMHNELRFSGWRVERLPAQDGDWIPKTWLPMARELISTTARLNLPARPADHTQRLARALLALEGLAIADALGELFFYRCGEAMNLVQHGYLPPAPWLHTDDTEMAISVVEVLRFCGAIDQDALARRFAWHFQQDPDRGYGSATFQQMAEVRTGKNWRTLAGGAFDGKGSMGNGSAMRVAPLGAYFADDLDRAVREAEASSAVTHTHPEGIAGAIAVAAAAAAAWQLRETPSSSRAAKFFEMVLSRTPSGRVREGIVQAASLPASKDVTPVAKTLGNGSLVTAPDTVPFALWCAAHHLGKYPKAVMAAISGGGDCDTTAAIAGGITAVSGNADAIPETWRESRESLPFRELKPPA